MRRRGCVKNRVRVLIASDTTRPASTHTLPLPPAQRTSSYAPLHPSSPCSPASSAGLSAATTSHALVLEKALTEVPEKLPPAEKAAFAQPSKTFDERTVLSHVQYLAIAPPVRTQLRCCLRYTASRDHGVPLYPSSLASACQHTCNNEHTQGFSTTLREA
jgi:hypothetical protein